ncbi:class I SAM-dependent methyltransferase [Vagococcus xieshaowenii]|uniref:Methyltransferase domain-containing protein n=1 Tax=Vagococcus xieshaowenii TaxID=2562451 RepID=A0AAJ5JLX5_9ENTE|nr:class I SAM-dependent methyltransferase [Vagococcus xieshaowenii]QCA28969.1 methyltransferase domain-containing protein [Vagococcus xieshaowenii]TFZ43149.1 methyltransferase domain-containing protein [Vagococcus xieshaowenii]
MLKSALHYSHDLLAQVVQPGNWVIDATVGNGHDTLFLAELVGKTGRVIGFDVQKIAIQRTTERLEDANLSQRCALHTKGHETIDELVPFEQLIHAAVFNLGYLPNSDKEVITQAQTTLTALKAIMKRLAPGGRIVVVVYYGHPGGLEEKNHVQQFAETLPQSDYNVLQYGFINQKNNPPYLLCIEKKRTKNAR